MRSNVRNLIVRAAIVISVAAVAVGVFFAFMRLGSDANRAEIMRFGKHASLTVVSYGQVVYEGTSTGKLKEKSGGYLFVEEGTGDTIQTLGENTTYIIRYVKDNK
jgi:hypothetical protein